MKVRLVLFAQYRELAGRDEIELDVPTGATAADMVRQLRADPRWQKLPVAPAVAVNQIYAPLSAALSEGDEVALIPPVAGG